MSIPQPKNMQELAQVLDLLLAPDTVKIKQGSAIMKVFLKNPACVQPLMVQIAQSPVDGHRQIAAVLLRRKIGTLWRKLPADVMSQVKATLLERLVAEKQRLVRMSIAALISALAKKIVPDGTWNELMQFLLQCCKSGETGHREVAMMLFRALAENIGDALKPHLATMQSIFIGGLQDPSDNVRTEALKALGVLVMSLETEEEVMAFRAVIPPMVAAVRQAVYSGNEEAAAVAFEAFDELVEVEASVLAQHIPIVIQLMAEVMVTPSIDMNIREKASMFVVQIIEAKTGKLIKHNLIEPLLDCCFRLSVEPYADSFEASDMTPQKLAVEILDALAFNTPKQLIYQRSMQHVSALLQPGQNDNNMKGGLVVVAVLAEGLSELFKDNLKQLIEVICACTKHSSSAVRSAAAVAITQFSDFLQPDILSYHEMILPCVFSMLLNPNEILSVKKRVVVAIEVFCEHMGDDLLPYVQQLMEMLVRLMQQGDPVIQECCINAIKSVAKAAKEKFEPYFVETIKMMGQLMSQKEDALLALRAKATECVGGIATAVGKARFGPYLPDFFRLAVEGTALECYQLREAAYSFFSSIALMLDTEFAQFMPTVMPLLIATCASDDGLVVNQEDTDAFGNKIEEEISDSDPDDEDDDEGMNRRVKFSIRSGALDEKIAAVETISTIANVVGEPLVPYLDKCIEYMQELSEYPHYIVRKVVLQAFEEIFGLLHTYFPNPEEWTPGNATKMHPRTELVVDLMIPVIISRMKDEEEKEVAAAACEALVVACKRFGLATIQDNIDDVYEATLDLLHERSPCQQAFDADDPENAEHDEVLIDSVTDVVGVLAQVVGGEFEPIFRQMFPNLVKFCQPHRPASDRSMAIGCIAEVTEAIGTRLEEYLPGVFTVVLAGLNDPSVAVRRNSAFCLGTIVTTNIPVVRQAYAQCLTALQPLFNIAGASERDKEQVMATRDNAASALAKMITAGAEALPLADVVKLMLSALPLVEDQSEAKYVYPCVIQLFSTHPDLMTPHIPAVISIFSQVLGTDHVEEPVKRGMVMLCKSFAQKGGPQVQAVIQALPPERAAIIMQALQQPEGPGVTIHFG